VTADAQRKRAMSHILLLAAGLLVLTAISAGSVHLVNKAREDARAQEQGGRAAWREFHDRFLSYGGPPIPLVREAMLGSPGGPLF